MISKIEIRLHSRCSKRKSLLPDRRGDIGWTLKRMDWILLRIYEDNPGRRTSTYKSTEMVHNEIHLRNMGILV